MTTRERLEEITGISDKNGYIANGIPIKELLEYIEQQDKDVKTKNEIIRLHQLTEQKLKKRIEFAEYLAQRCDQAFNEENETLQAIDNEECGYESWSDYFSSTERSESIQAIKSAIYEFRKRK